jgi:diguanylate cyclase (GGDEF)-like protein
MTDATWAASRRQAVRRIRELLSSRLPFVITFGCVLLLNWAAAAWLLQHTYHERENTAFQLVSDEVKYAEQKFARLFIDADRTLLELRTLFPGDHARLEEQLGQPPRPIHGGVALIAPDGHLIAGSSHASTAGWPRLMSRLASSEDVLAVGEPIVAKGGHLIAVPLARRLVEPDGSFAGIVMFSLEADAFPAISPAVAALDGSMSLISEDGVILTRAPAVRGTLGMRVARPGGAAWPARGEVTTGRGNSLIDGVDRIFAYQHQDGIPTVLIVGIGHEAAFAAWDTLRMIVIGTRVISSSLILLAAYLWYTRRRQARISADALTAILTSIDHGIRVQGPEGQVIANQAGALLVPPEQPGARSELRRIDGAVVETTRHDLDSGGMVLIGIDVTARSRAEARVEFLLSHDPLTRLPNRWRAAAHIQELLRSRAAKPRMAALILLDLDGFQDINDTLGHEGGDEVLIEVARRLRGLVADNDVVARLGGDEFLLCLDDPDDEEAVTSLARQIPRAIARAIDARGQEVHLGLSMGIALYPRDATDAATLFRAADLALSWAKQAGRGSAQRFQPRMMVSFEEHRMMESDLRHAIETGALELVLQPQFACDSLEVTGFEALTRWHHPTRGELSPAVFIPVAERSGLINPLGLWAIEQACKAAAGWRARHRVAANLSPLQLRCETIQEDIRGILRRTQFPAHLLELEVTESVLLDEDQRTLETLHKLRAMDIRITLDDFGAGYSSLSYLRRFPFDKIKIDKSFVQSGGTDRGTRVILEAMIRMCTDLGFDVVAEGVETEQQLADLRQLGCREIQGFLLGEPLRPDMVEDFLVDHGRLLMDAKTPAS